MSAICGAIEINPSGLPVLILEKMMHQLRSHGQDQSGHWRTDQVVMGHQMMHITPESVHEKLPFHHSESRLTITADARLDNREDLCALMGVHASPTSTDSELILRAYQTWGLDCVEKLVGEFSFAIWDGRDHRLHCFTDSMGIRPLFYRVVKENYFAFASEVSALLCLDDSKPAINYRRLAMLGVSALTTHLDTEATCFEGIFRVPAASILSVSGRLINIKKYWAPDAEKRIKFRSINEFQEAYREVTFKAIKPRTRSIYPVASFLSGGLDSSSIVAAASQMLSKDGQELVTLSSVPTPDAADQVTGEREFMKLFESWQNLDMIFVDAKGCGPFDQIEKLVQTASPCSYSFQHFLYTALVRAANARDARVILDGHGGEISVSAQPMGYFSELLLHGKFKTLVRELRFLDSTNRLKLAPIKRHVLRPMVPYPLQVFLGRQSQFKQLLPYPIKNEFVLDVLGPEIDDIKSEVHLLLREFPDHRKNLVKNIRYEQTNVQQRLHAGFVDYHKAQISYPYLDRRVIEFCLATDGSLKYLNGTGRQLVRKGMEGILPEEIKNRLSKAAFAPDYHLRYKRDRHIAKKLLDDCQRTAELDQIIDFKRIYSALEVEPVYLPNNPIRSDHISQILIPNAVYLCYFLTHFPSEEFR